MSCQSAPSADDAESEYVMRSRVASAAHVAWRLTSSSGFWATPTSALGTPVMSAYVAPAIAAPMMGAMMNNHTCASAALPANHTTPSERAGLTDAFVTGMATRLVTAKPRPIAMGATPGAAILERGVPALRGDHA